MSKADRICDVVFQNFRNSQNIKLLTTESKKRLEAICNNNEEDVLFFNLAMFFSDNFCLLSKAEWRDFFEDSEMCVKILDIIEC